MLRWVRIILAGVAGSAVSGFYEYRWCLIKGICMKVWIFVCWLVMCRMGQGSVWMSGLFVSGLSQKLFLRDSLSLYLPGSTAVQRTG